jgi:TonB family protein
MENLDRTEITWPRPCSGLLRRALFPLLLGLLPLAPISFSQGSIQPVIYVKHLAPPPSYPPLARSIHSQGTVVLKLRIAPDGKVLSVEAALPEDNVVGFPILRDSAENLVKNWTFGCANCGRNEPFEQTIRFEYKLRDGGIPYDDSTVVMNLPNEVTVTATPVQCDHCPVETPAWCKPLPRPEYKSLHHVKISDPWFEVYRVAPSTLAIYEPHQSEETISYLILGKDKAILFDTGMGISNLRNVIYQVTKLPIIVLNSHTHNDHVGDNWQFDTIYSMDTDFSRTNAKGSSADAQAEIALGEICGNLPQFFNGRDYRTQPWKISRYIHDGDKLDLGGRAIEILSTPGHTPDAITLFDRANGLLFTGDTYYPAPIWLFRPETDLDAYAKSIQRLAALAPQVKVVLGAHNIPVAPPSVLTELVTAFAALRAGKASCSPLGDGKRLCKVGTFSFLLRSTP